VEKLLIGFVAPLFKVWQVWLTAATSLAACQLAECERQ